MGMTAAALIIGNELLSGKIQELNVAFLGKELYGQGIRLSRVVMCLDDINTIAAELNGLRSQYDHVFTSGGVGPTHDDMTLPAVAQAFRKRLVRSEEIAKLIRGYHGNRTNEAHLKMADVPEGARLITNATMQWPTVAVDNVYIFPGVPEVFRMKFEVLRHHLGCDAQYFSRASYTQCDEGQIAAQLEQLEITFPGVSIGSYPTFRSSDYQTKITFDGRDSDETRRAQIDFENSLEPRQLVRSE